MATKARKRKGNPGVILAVLGATGRLGNPTFNELLEDLKATGTLANHRSLRAYLDVLVASKAVRVKEAPARSLNIRMRQTYTLTGRGPFVTTGWAAMAFHGLGWELPDPGGTEVKTDAEGVARGTLHAGVLYGSLEDTVVFSLGRARGAEERAMASTYSAALLSAGPFDEAYLLRRARGAGVIPEVRELLAELRAAFYSPKFPARDVKTLYAIRREGTRLRPLQGHPPRWTVLSPDALLDVVGKQLGVK